MVKMSRVFVMILICTSLGPFLSACRFETTGSSQPGPESGQSLLSASPVPETEETPEDTDRLRFDPVTRDTLARDVMNDPVFGAYEDEEDLWEPEEPSEFSIRANVPPDSGEPVILAESFFVLTGSFAHCGGDERQIQVLIEAKGGHCRPSVSGKTNYLVLGSKGDWGDNKRIDTRRQMELGSDIRIIWEDALFNGESDSAALTRKRTQERAERYERFLSSMPSEPFRNEDGSPSSLAYPYDTPSEIRFAGKTFCTGLVYFTEQYRDLTQQIEDRGGRCTFQVSGRTDYLILSETISGDWEEVLHEALERREKTGKPLFLREKDLVEFLKRC